jgi:hypothetical protein
MARLDPDTPALRVLLQSIDDKLDIPSPTHHADDDLELAALRAAIHDVQLAVRTLLAGPFDNCAIQNWGHVLTRQTVPVHYEVNAA